MRNGNVGFDFICNRDKKIDVKSSCITLAHQKNPRWIFNINENIVADYFLLIAFKNRDELTIHHIWLIPGSVLNHIKSTVSISPSTIDKWSEFMQPIGPALACCNTIKGQ